MCKVKLFWSFKVFVKKIGTCLIWENKFVQRLSIMLKVIDFKIFKVFMIEKRYDIIRFSVTESRHNKKM